MEAEGRAEDPEGLVPDKRELLRGYQYGRIPIPDIQAGQIKATAAEGQIMETAGSGQEKEET